MRLLRGGMHSSRSEGFASVAALRGRLCLSQGFVSKVAQKQLLRIVLVPVSYAADLNLLEAVS